MWLKFAALWVGELVAALGAVMEDRIFDRLYQKQIGGDLVAQAMT